MGWADRCQHDAKLVLLTWHRVPASLFFFFFDHQAITLRMGSPLFIDGVCSDFSFHRRAMSTYSYSPALPLISMSWRARYACTCVLECEFMSKRNRARANPNT